MIDAPNLSPAERERLVMLVEECGEVIQAAAKILRHGYQSGHPGGGPSNRQLLVDEIKDVFTILTVMHDIDDIDLGDELLVQEELRAIWNRKLRWTHHQSF
jgi:NTP pyrophosphatase (non-canonical NTP hydrolase)